MHHHHHHHDGQARTHVAVRERRGPGGTQYAAIFFGLREGEYTLWGVDGEPADTVSDRRWPRRSARLALRGPLPRDQPTMTSPPDDSLDSLLADSGAQPASPSGRLLSRRTAVRVQLHRRPVQATIAALTVIAVVVGIVLVFAGSTPRRLPPTPPSPVAAKPITQVPTEQLTPTTPATSPTATKVPTVCAASLLAPVDITIPAIGVHSCLLQLGLNADRTVETPTLKQVGEAGWYKYSAAPGAIGPAVILGHIDSAQYGPGVFFKLGTLIAGEPITITRADHSIVTFRVTKVAEYPKTSFPTQQIYGGTKDAELRLVTCGGRFDPSTGSYLDNIVAFASLASVSHG